MSVFKAYDIRGKYPGEINETFAYRLGYFLPELLDVRQILVGYDTRISSEALLESFKNGCMDSGCDVYDMGLSTTPMVYFATCRRKFPASVMITASHNDKEYNGFKISGAYAAPIGLENGLAELGRMMEELEATICARRGKSYQLDVKEEYLAFLKGQLPAKMPLKLALDCSNGMASLFAKELFGEQLYLNDTLDGTFPNHSPNPLLAENCAQLQKAMQGGTFDFGVVFDGDADRAVFLDETGKIIPSDLMIAFLASELSKPGDTVMFDVRTSKAVKEYLEDNGIIPYMWKVGHYFAKQKLRELDAVFGGELAGHYYFKAFFYCDSALFAAASVYKTVCRLKKSGETLSGFIRSLPRYENSGEINFKIEQKEAAILKVVDHFRKQKEPLAYFDFDGIRMEYEDWWFNIRKSNTEPYLRLIAEAKDHELLTKKLEEIKKIIRSCIK